ncbi:MAG TPA: hypothetical protein PKW90_03525 [Myxococcota bacterium]|nr:hypothetical protein [Myxococcota bacterium]
MLNELPCLFDVSYRDLLPLAAGERWPAPRSTRLRPQRQPPPPLVRSSDFRIAA